MGRVRPPYPAEFKRQMVELVRAGRTPEELVNWSHGDCAFASRQSQVDDEIWPAHALRREIPSVTHHFCGDPAS